MIRNINAQQSRLLLFLSNWTDDHRDLDNISRNSLFCPNVWSPSCPYLGLLYSTRPTWSCIPPGVRQKKGLNLNPHLSTFIICGFTWRERLFLTQLLKLYFLSEIHSSSGRSSSSTWYAQIKKFSSYSCFVVFLQNLWNNIATLFII